jgi:hypothetical protein
MGKVVKRWDANLPSFGEFDDYTILENAFSILAQNLGLSLREQNRVGSFVGMVLSTIPTGIKENPNQHTPQYSIVWILFRFLPAFLRGGPQKLDHLLRWTYQHLRRLVYVPKAEQIQP